MRERLFQTACVALVSILACQLSDGRAATFTGSILDLKDRQKFNVAITVEAFGVDQDNKRVDLPGFENGKTQTITNGTFVVSAPDSRVKAVTIIFSRPGLKTSGLFNISNDADKALDVVMPKDDRPEVSIVPCCQIHHGFFRRLFGR